MSNGMYRFPIVTGRFVKHEVKRVKILTGKYKGQIRDFCHFTESGKIVVNVEPCRNLTYNKTSVEFVSPQSIYTQEIINE